MGSLVPIIAVPILFTTAVAAYNAFTSSQQQFRDTLEAVASLKTGQVDALVQSVRADLNSISKGTQGAPSIMHVLQKSAATTAVSLECIAGLHPDPRFHLGQHPDMDYEEVLVLDTRALSSCPRTC